MQRTIQLGLLCAGVALSACGGGSSSPAPAPLPIPTPPPLNYSIGGTVSGLNSSVLLQNNGGDDLSVNANGSFAFATALTGGTNYNVTVKTQPSAPTQICTVSNGTGIVASGNVGNVSIVCANVPLTLASATPTSGSSNIARDVTPTLIFSTGINPATAIAANITLSSALGNQPIAIAASGTQLIITPSNYLQPTTLYALNLSTALRGMGGEQPTNPINVTFITRDADWSAPALLETDDAGNASKPQVAIDADGTAIAVWHQFDGARNKIWFNEYSPPSGWGTAAQLQPSSTFEALAPRVAVDGNGKSMIVWLQANTVGYNVWWSRYTRGSGFSTPAQLSLSDTAAVATVAVNNGGEAVAVWTESSPTQTVARRYSPSSGWDAVTPLQNTFAFAATTPQVAIDQNGNATAVWAQSDGTRYHVWANRYSSGSWGAAQAIENNLLGPSTLLYPQVAMDASGNAAVVWQQSDGTRNNAWANRYAGGWSVPTPIEHDDGPAIYPQIAMDAAGNAVAVWEQAGTTVSNIVSNRFTIAGGWGTATLVENDDSGESHLPQIAMTTTGTAQVVWMHYRDSTRYDIFANRYVPGSGWSTPKLVGNEDNSASHSAYAPQVAINANGTAQAIWLRDNGSRVNVWSARFE